MDGRRKWNLYYQYPTRIWNSNNKKGGLKKSWKNHSCHNWSHTMGVLCKVTHSHQYQQWSKNCNKLYQILSPITFNSVCHFDRVFLKHLIILPLWDAYIKCWNAEIKSQIGSGLGDCTSFFREKMQSINR